MLMTFWVGKFVGRLGWVETNGPMSICDSSVAVENNTNRKKEKDTKYTRDLQNTLFNLKFPTA